MTDMPSSPSEWDDQPEPDRGHSGPDDRRLTIQPIPSQTADSDGPRSDRPPEGEPDARDHAGSGVPDLEGLRRMQLQLAVATVTSAISPKVSAVVGTHLKTLIDSDPSMRSPRGSSATSGGAKQGDGTTAPAGDRPGQALSEEEVDLLLDNALACNPAAVQVLERFFTSKHVERVRTFFAESS